MRPITSRLQVALLGACAVCSLTSAPACKKIPPSERAVSTTGDASPKGRGSGAGAHHFQLDQGPDLSALANQGQPKRPPPEQAYLQPFDSAGFLLPVGPTGVSGLAHFQDTIEGMRVTVSVRGLPSGDYVLQADESFYGPSEGVTCDEAQNAGILTAQPVRWVFGPLHATSTGVARFDKVYKGVGNRAGAHKVPAQPIVRPNTPTMVIRLKEFQLLGRRLTLHKLPSDSEGQLGEPLACAIISTGRTFGRATFKPFPGQTISGSAYFEQGEDNRAVLEVELSELAASRHRLVVHEFGDCGDLERVGQPYQPEDATLITQPHYPWPLKKGNLGAFKATNKGVIKARTRFDHPLTSGSPHIIRGRAILVERLDSEQEDGKGTPIGCAMITEF